MKLYFLISFFFLANLLSAQDIIETVDGKRLEVKIDGIGVNAVKYHKHDNLSGPAYEIKKTQVVKIIYEDGTTEFVSFSDRFASFSQEEIKRILTEKINEFAFEYRNDKKTYQATFEGDYIRLRLKHIDGDFYNDDLVLDFSNVYDFQRVSKREQEIAFINIFVSKLKNKKKNTWEKYKLVMQVNGHENAQIINDAFKHYNYLLLSKKE